MYSLHSISAPVRSHLHQSSRITTGRQRASTFDMESFIQSSDSTRTSSSASEQSEQKHPRYPQYPLGGLRTNGSRPTSRAASYTPSYMAMSIPQAPAAPKGEQNGRSISVHTPQSRSASTASSVNIYPTAGTGVLFVIAASSLPPSLLQYLETILSRQTFAGIVLAARQEHEAELKQLKMDTYALIGKLRREMSVETRLRESWSPAEMTSLLQEGTRQGAGVQGVLCCPDFAINEVADILNFSEHNLQTSWQESVAFVHAASRTLIPHLLTTAQSVKSAANGRPSKEPRGPFFLVTTTSNPTSASAVTKAAVDALVQQLVVATESTGLLVGHAESTLIPDPIGKDNFKPQLEPMITDLDYNGHVQDSTFAAGESPTKLWNMWALQEQLDRAD